MNITGVLYRTSSSTAVSIRPLKSAISSSRWPGKSVSSTSECEIAFRVVSLPATTSRMKNEASSALVSCSPSMFALASAVTRSSPGRPARSAASPVTSSASSAPAVAVVGDSHQLADDGQRHPGGHVLDEVAGATVEQVIDDRGGHQLHVGLELLDHPWGERAR